MILSLIVAAVPLGSVPLGFATSCLLSTEFPASKTENLSIVTK